MKTIAMLLLLLTVCLPVAGANPIVSASNKVENSLSIHEWAHFGIGYAFADQLHRRTKMTPLEIIVSVAFLGYAKERWIDSEFNGREAAATMAGALVYQF